MTGVLVGIVLSAGTGAPEVGAHVVIDLPGDDDPALTVAADGSFRGEVPAGTWTVQLRRPDGALVPLDAVRVVDGRETELLVSLDGAVALVTVEAPPEVGVVADAILGSVEGRAVDEAGQPVPGARVVVRGQPVHAVTDADGRFAIALPVGPHDVSVIAGGFSSRTVAVEVAVDAPVDLAVAMLRSGATLSDFFVKAPRVEGGTATVLEERRDSSSVSDVLGAEQMKKSGDADAAAALRRVTGLTVVGGRYVYVRGLGDRYSATLLNGSTLPSPEPEKRVVPLDLFPTSLLESVVVQKTASPDRPGEFGGGVVQIRTRGLPSEPVVSIGLSGAYRSGTSLAEAMSGARGPTDWLGIGGGTRDLPPALAATDQPLKPKGLFSTEGYSPDEIEAFGEQIEDRWGLASRTLPPDWGLSAALGNGWDTGGPRLGALAGLSFGNGWSLDHAVRSVYATSNGELALKRRTSWDELTNRVRFGGILALGADWGDHEIRSTTLLNRVSEYGAVVYDADDPTGSGDSRTTRLSWVEQQLLFQQVSGHHPLGERAPAIDWRYAGSLATRAEPDEREYTYIDTQEGYRLSQKGSWNQIRYGDLDDVNHDAGLDVAQPIGEGQVKVGVNAVLRHRTSTSRRFGYEFAGSTGIDLSKPISQILVPENIGSEGPGDEAYLQLLEVTSKSDDYVAKQRLLATYAMAELPFGRVRTLVGARVESSLQTAETFELFNPAQEVVAAALQTTDLLPAATVTVAIGRGERADDMLLRLGYGRTLSRPELRELSEVPYSSWKTGGLVYGEPELKRATIDNVDLRWELYPRPGESLSVAAFWKGFTDPIESVAEVSAVSGSASTFANARAASNLGVEIDARQALDVLHPALADLFVAGNAAVIRSRVDLEGTSGNQTSQDRPLQGQSPYVVNVQAGWDDPVRGASVTVLYNVFGPRIVEVGRSGVPDSYDLPVHRLDLVALARPAPAWQIGVKATNLLDWPIQQRTGPEISESSRDGWGVGLQVGWAP